MIGVVEGAAYYYPPLSLRRRRFSSTYSFYFSGILQTRHRARQDQHYGRRGDAPASQVTTVSIRLFNYHRPPSPPSKTIIPEVELSGLTYRCVVYNFAYR